MEKSIILKSFNDGTELNVIGFSVDDSIKILSSSTVKDIFTVGCADTSKNKDIYDDLFKQEQKYETSLIRDRLPNNFSTCHGFLCPACSQGFLLSVSDKDDNDFCNASFFLKDSRSGDIFTISDNNFDICDISNTIDNKKKIYSELIKEFINNKNSLIDRIIISDNRDETGNLICKCAICNHSDNFNAFLDAYDENETEVCPICGEEVEYIQKKNSLSRVCSNDKCNFILDENYNTIEEEF